ncbi:MAG: hypothetical protein N2044_06635 [Cyclobacteriaceae bacterium]|nr:hypothetical protein [Cyclobacteriaceae bacterium]MCX7637504.1 hypothetical protein [Cyclobacteriaceae bacterium]MDW8332027.1 hypothetical protein [Cyclobacteriaceae bacterium]
MRKVFVIFLLALFLFYTGGYYLFYFAIKHHRDVKLSRLFDSGLPESASTVTLKIPLTLPYPIHTSGFERINGEFEFDGEFYKMVKHKLENDTLHIVCYKDVQAKRLSSALNDIARFSSDLPASSSAPFAFFIKLLKDYEPSLLPGLTHACLGWQQNLHFEFITSSPIQPVVFVHTPPPRS